MIQTKETNYGIICLASILIKNKQLKSVVQELIDLWLGQLAEKIWRVIS